MKESLSLFTPAATNVLLIVGPDEPLSAQANPYMGEAYAIASFSEIIQNAKICLEDYGVDLTIVGNGKPDTAIDLHELKAAIQKQPEGSTIFVLAHGAKIDESNHVLCNYPYGEDGKIIFDSPCPLIPITRLFDIIKATDKKMDVVMLSCESDITHKAANDMLPAGSRFLTFGDGKLSRLATWLALDYPTLESSIKKEFPRGKFAFEEFVVNAISQIRGYGDKISPRLTIAGFELCPLSDLLERDYNKPFTRVEFAAIA